MKKKELWLKPMPPNAATCKVAVNFKLAEQDIGKVANDVLKLEEDMTISFISANSFFNGLIMGDKVLKVNEATAKANCLGLLLKGDVCSVEVQRRKGATPVPKDRMTRSGTVMKKGLAYFVLDVERPTSTTTTAVGLKLSVMKKRAFVIKIDPNTIASTFFGRGDMIIDMDGLVIPQSDSAENFIREHLSRLTTGKRVSFLVERPIAVDQAREYQKFIESITYDDADVEMAKDVVDIGREASNMHFIVLKKLVTPSILTADVKKAKKGGNKTSDASESNITISTASTEMKIASDVPDSEDLKPVVTKSHAAGSSDSDGAFDDE